MRTSLSVVCLLAAVAVVVGTSVSAAQDLSFTVEESGQKPSAPPPSAGPPSPTLAAALRSYQQEKYEEASVGFQQVVEGKTRDPEGNKQKAQFFLAKSLYHLKFYQSSLALLDTISQAGTSHLFFAESLQWLAQLASQLPESAGISEKIGRYNVSQIAQFNSPQYKGLYPQLLYLMGRHKYDKGDFTEAVRLFQQVDEKSEYYVKAKFFEGISYVRLRKAQPATASFRKIVVALDDRKLKNVDDKERMTNLAWISLARVYYTAANRLDARSGERSVDGRLLGNAVEAWNRVAQSSEYWLDALFEESWAFFLADEYARALGNVHTIYSPYFKDAYYPEALVLKAVTFFVNCQIENARATVGQFHERFDPVQQELTSVLGRYQDNNQFFEFLKRVRAGEANLSPRIRGIVASALSDRQLLQNLEYVRLLEEEEKRLREKPATFQNSSLGARISQDIAIAKSFAVDQAGDLARARYDRLVRELQELMNQVDTIELEIATYERGQLSQELQEQQTAAARSKGGAVEVDEEHQMWPFNGEYWRDELGFYRQRVTNRCGR